MRAGFATVVVLVGGLLSGCATAAGPVTARSRPASSFGVTIESSDQKLAGALLAEAVKPSAENHLQVAREYVRLGIHDLAHTRTRRALKREPRLAAAHDMMARIWRDWGQRPTALAHAHRAVYFEPASAAAHNTLGTILDGLGESKAARSAFLKAFELDPTAGWALSNLCYLEFRLGNLEEARRRCEAAVLATPALSEAHNNLGLTHAAAGDLGRAREAFLAGGDAASADYNMGIVFLAGGRYVEAALAFIDAVKTRPTFTAAKTRAHEARMRALGAIDRQEP